MCVRVRVRVRVRLCVRVRVHARVRVGKCACKCEGECKGEFSCASVRAHLLDEGVDRFHTTTAESNDLNVDRLCDA